MQQAGPAPTTQQLNAAGVPQAPTSMPNAPTPTAPDWQSLVGQQQQENQNVWSKNAMDRGGVWGSSTFTRDANGNPTGVNTSLDPRLQGGANSLSGAYSSMAGLLPQDRFDSTSAAPNTDYISNTFYNKGAALLDPQFSQARKEQEVRLAERGIPLGSEISTTEQGNLQRNQNLALSDLASQATLMAPQEQQRMINNARSDYQMPLEQLSGMGSNLGLLGGLVNEADMPQLQGTNVAGIGLQGSGQDFTQQLQAAGFTSDQIARMFGFENQEYQNQRANITDPYQMELQRIGQNNNASQQDYQNQLGRYNSKMAGVGQLVGTGMGLLTAPMTGGASLAGMLGSGMSNVAQGAPWSYGNSWAPWTQAA